MPENEATEPAKEETANETGHTPPKTITATVDGTSTKDNVPPSKRYVLVVEDSMPLRRMLGKILSTMNIETTEAANGQEALDKIREVGVSTFDLIILDLMMPVMDGAKFLAEAKNLYPDEMPAVLICSSRSDRETIGLVMRFGIEGYILKPFKTDTVMNKIREIFPELSEVSQ
jgi:DNA-binding response OmpR family regulator